MPMMDFTSRKAQQAQKDGTATIIRQLNFQDYEGEYVDITADFVEFGDDRQTGNKGANANVENISINGEKVNECICHGSKPHFNQFIDCRFICHLSYLP